MQSPPKVGICIASGATCPYFSNALRTVPQRACRISIHTLRGIIFEVDCKNANIYIPKRYQNADRLVSLFFCPFFSYNFQYKSVSGAYAPMRFLVSEVFLQCGNHHFPVIFESMSDREKGGIINNAERYDRHTENAHFKIGGKNERIEKRNKDLKCSPFVRQCGIIEIYQ